MPRIEYKLSSVIRYGCEHEAHWSTLTRVCPDCNAATPRRRCPEPRSCGQVREVTAYFSEGDYAEVAVPVSPGSVQTKKEVVFQRSKVGLPPAQLPTVDARQKVIVQTGRPTRIVFEPRDFGRIKTDAELNAFLRMHVTADPRDAIEEQGGTAKPKPTLAIDEVIA